MTTKTRAPIAQLGGSALKTDDSRGPLAFNPNTGELFAGRKRISAWQVPDVSATRTLDIDKAINGFGFLPEGEHLVTYTNTELARLDLASGSIEVLATFEERLQAMALSPDSGRVALGGRGMVPTIHDTRTGELVQTLGKHRSTIYSVAFDAEGTRLATASGKVARVWSLSAKKPKALRGSRNVLSRVLFSPDGRLLLGQTFKYELHVWEIDTGTLLWSDTKNWAQSWFSPDSQHILTCSLAEPPGQESSWCLIRSEARTGERVGFLPMHDAASTCALSSNGRFVATTATGHNTISLWDLEEGTEIAVAEGHKGEIQAISKTPDGGSILTGSKDAHFIAWSSQTHALTRSMKLASYQRIQCVAFSPDGDQMALGEDQKVCLRHTGSWAPIWTTYLDQNRPTHVVFLKGGDLLMALCEPNYKAWDRVFFLDAATGEIVKRFDKIPMALNAARENLEGTEVTAVGSKGALTFDLTDFKIVKRVSFPEAPASFADLESKGTHTLRTASKEPPLEMIDTASGRVVHALPVPHGTLARFLRGGALVLAISPDGTWTLWDTRDGQCIEQFSTDHANPRRLFRLDEGSLATTHEEGTALVWDIGDLNEIPLPEKALASEDPNEQFGGLRALVYQTPDEKGWAALCNLLDGWDDTLDLALDYAEPHLSTWPEALRIMPDHWLADLMNRRDQPRARLARVIIMRDAYDASMANIAAHPAIANLTALYLMGKGFTNKGAVSLAESTHLNNLTTLSFAQTNMRINGARALASAPFLAGLTSLRISSPIGPKGAAAVISNPALNKLDTLNLYNCKLAGPAFTEAFIAAEHLASVKTLDLGQNRGLDLRAIADAPHLTNLESIDINCYGCPVSHFGHFTRAPHLATLKELSMGAFYMEEADARHLAEAVFADALTNLDVSFTRSVPVELIKRIRARFTNLDEHAINHLDYILRYR